ncbi:MAG: hypothetical protein HY815_26045 [Candidatus Riflebacteria bacterium]|nr:hypothetical protein [Candidatus Riflebacteria bacterium]
MRWVLLLAVGFSATAAWATEFDVSEGYLGWGGDGAQVFRSKVSIVRNNLNNDRAVLVIVDDMKPRGSRRRLSRVTVDYVGGRNASERLLSAIRNKTFTYQMQPMYKKAALSPRSARVVLPRADGVRATLRFYYTLHRPMDGESEKDLAPELTRTVDTGQIEALPPLNPFNSAVVRRPRYPEDEGVQVATARAVPDADAAAQGEPGRPTVDEPPGSGETAGGAADEGRSKEELAMARARELARTARRIDQPEPEQAVDGEVPDPVGIAGEGPEGPAAPASGRMAVLEDTPEMVEAERRAMERIRKMGLEAPAR